MNIKVILVGLGVLFASVLSAQSPGSCEACQHGDIVGQNSSGTYLSYTNLQSAFLAIDEDHLSTIYVCEGDYNEFPTLKNAANLQVLACGAVTINGLIFKENRNVIVDGFDIDAAGYWSGITMVGYGEPYVNHDLTIRNSRIHNSEGAGVRIGRGNYNITFDQCQIDNNHNGLEILDEGHGDLVSNCTIENNRYIGAVVTGGIELTFVGNTIRNNTYFAISCDIWNAPPSADPSDITLLLNSFSGNNGYVVPGTHDANLGNYHYLIDASDDQPGY